MEKSDLDLRTNGIERDRNGKKERKEREKEKEAVDLIETSGGASDRWKIQPLSLAFNAGETFGYNGSCVRPDECSN